MRPLGKATYESDASRIRPLLMLESDQQASINAWSTAISCYLGLPGLRGFWPLTHLDGGGYYLDLGGNGLTLTNYNNVYLSGSGLQGFSVFTRASSTYLSRADEAAFDIVGTETYITDTYKGLTVGAWIIPYTKPSATQGLIAKWTETGNQRSYILYMDSADKFSMGVSGTGADIYSATASSAVTINTWYFVVGRYIKATPEVDLWVGETEVTTGASVPSALYSSSAAFTMGAIGNPAYYANAGMCLAFLCAAALSDNTIKALYRKTKGLFGY